MGASLISECRIHTRGIHITDDIYNHSKRLESAMKNLKVSGISESNKQLVERFVQSCFAQGLSKSRIVRYIQNLKQIALFIDRDLDQCNRGDIERLVAEIEMRDYSEWTRHFYKVTLKKFYKWLNNCDRGESPEIVKWMRTSVKKNRLRTPDILTGEEIERMVSVCTNIRNRVFISVLAESGCRLGEVWALRKRDVQYDSYGAILRVTGKTGFRPVRIIKSSKLLHDWTDRLNDDSLLWINKNGNLISHGYIRKCLKSLAIKSNINKRVYPYSLRHARATFMSQHLTEAQMKVFFGWTQDSRMASYYVHLSGKDIDKTLIKLSEVSS